MKSRKILALIISALMLLGLLSGCGASSDKATMESVSTSTGAYAPDTPMEMPEIEYDSNYGYGYGSGADMPADDMKAEENIGQNQGGSIANAKLIYTANLELESTEFDAAVSGLEALVQDMGGYFENSYVNNYGSYRSGNYTVRVPAENFDAFCSAVGELCQLNSISRSAQDVSEEYYDTESRLITQQTKLARLQELLAKAENMEDIITLESAISDTEWQIEQLTGTLRRYDSLVGFSTVSIYLQEVYKLTEVEQPVIGFGAKLAQAFETGCSNFVNGLERSILRFARHWTDWLIFAIVVVIIIVVVRLVLKKRRLRKEAFRKAREEKNTEDK